MVTCIMPSDTSDHCAFNASLRISWDRRESKSHCQRRTTEDRFHRGQLLFCLIDDLWFCSRDGRLGVLAAARSFGWVLSRIFRIDQATAPVSPALRRHRMATRPDDEPCLMANATVLPS